LIERIGRIEGFGFGGSIEGWKAEMGVELLGRIPDCQLVIEPAILCLLVEGGGGSITRHLPR
jgi:hypothetical protein